MAPALNEINACRGDADCILVREGYCGGAAAINAIRKGQTVELAATLRALDTGWGLGYGFLSVQAHGDITAPIVDAIIVELHVDQYNGRYRILEP